MMYIYLQLLVIWALLKPGISTNQAPVIAGPTSHITVGENENSQVLLTTLTVSDADNDAVTCVIQSTNPSTSDFGIWSNSSGYDLNLLADSTLNFTLTPAYRLVIECSDGTTSTSRTVAVHVIPNSPPTFDTLPVITSSQNSNSVERGDTIYTVSASDADSTSLSFSMTSFPVSPSLFEIDAGKVTAIQDLIYAVNRAYDLTITVTDSKASTTSNLIIPIHNVNSAPIINNLPSDIYMMENTNSNTVLFTLSITDPDSGDTSAIAYVVSPSIYTNKFSMDGADVKLASTINYEEVDQVTLTFVVTDGKATTNNTDYCLTVNVVDVNEECRFEYNNYYVTMTEGNTDGYSVDPGFEVTDVDVWSSFTYELQNVAAATYFTVDNKSGLIGFSVDYDVDTTHLNSTSFAVYCRDNYGSTDSAILYVTVEDINDNAPVFDDTGYVFYFDQTMTVPYNVGDVTATDADSGENADIDYTWTTTGTGSTYFNLLPGGTIVLQRFPQYFLTYGDTFRFVVTASDNGSPVLTGATTVDLVYREKTEANSTSATSTVAPSDEDSFWEKWSNVALVVVGVVLGCVIVGLAALGVLQYRGKIELFKTNQPKVQPKPKPESTPFSFWKADEFKNVSSSDPKRTSPMKAPGKTSTNSAFTF